MNDCISNRSASVIAFTSWRTTTPTIPRAALSRSSTWCASSTITDKSFWERSSNCPSTNSSASAASMSDQFVNKQKEKNKMILILIWFLKDYMFILIFVFFSGIDSSSSSAENNVRAQAICRGSDRFGCSWAANDFKCVLKSFPAKHLFISDNLGKMTACFEPRSLHRLSYDNVPDYDAPVRNFEVFGELCVFSSIFLELCFYL
jgi:hypothetical protein